MLHTDLDAVVWVADDQVADGLDYGFRLAERLEASGIRVKRVDFPDASGDVPTAGVHVLSGGGTSVWDPSGWMPAGLRLTRSLVSGALHGEHAVLGVCLGSQMIAEVLWPGSVRSGERIEVGLAEVAWHPVDAADRERLVVPVFHYEEVDRASATAGGAFVVAENERAGLQGFRVGDRLWGVQFHPELTPADARRLVAYHRPTIEAHDNSVEAALATVDKLEPEWSSRAFEQILARVTERAAR